MGYILYYCNDRIYVNVPSRADKYTAKKKRKSVKIEARDDASGQPLWGVISAACACAYKSRSRGSGQNRGLIFFQCTGSSRVVCV